MWKFEIGFVFFREFKLDCNILITDRCDYLIISYYLNKNINVS